LSKSSDQEVIALLRSALDALGYQEGETNRGDAALTTARTALVMLAASLIGAVQMDEDELRGIIEPKIGPSTLQ
jgi:hypothetical protein